MISKSVLNTFKALSSLRVIPIPLYEDNYAYLIHGSKKENSFLVDPADANAIFSFLTSNPEYTISHILLTHKHWDHAGGVPDLLKLMQEHYTQKGYPEYKVEVVSGANDNIPNTTISIPERTSFDVNEIKITAIPTPCHTRGAVCFYLEDINNTDKTNDTTLENVEDCYRCVFTGDTVFIGGCGRFFEGTAEEMLKNFDVFGTLPKDTFVFCGHEYTVSNLEFADNIEWENEAYGKKLIWAQEKRKNGIFTVPSTVGEESEMNIFMRCRTESLQKKLGKSDPVEVMATLREYKNNKMSLKQKL